MVYPISVCHCNVTLRLMGVSAHLHIDHPHISSLYQGFSFLFYRFKDVWSYAQALDSASCWNELAEAALHHLDIPLGT